VPNNLEKSEKPKESEPSATVQSANAQREVQDYQKNGLVKDIFGPEYSDKFTKSFLPDLIFTNTDVQKSKEEPKSLSDIVRSNHVTRKILGPCLRRISVPGAGIDAERAVW